LLRKIDHESMGTSDLGWLKSRFHFSFADYYNPKNIHFGPLRVLNDDQVQAGTGFDTHPHRDMEIISYIVEGELTHGDSMGNRQTLSRGQVQYMSAGTGVRHSEHNRGSGILRFLQIWIVPDRQNHEPRYGDHRFVWEDRKNRWLPLVSGTEGKAPIRIHQDATISVLELDPGREIVFPVGEGRQAYLVQIEGSSEVNGIELGTRDALETVAEGLTIRAQNLSHFLVIEMGR
jgi:redox-sensitive bicupin YhaK (pirin superfamily)